MYEFRWRCAAAAIALATTILAPTLMALGAGAALAEPARSDDANNATASADAGPSRDANISDDQRATQPRAGSTPQTGPRAAKETAPVAQPLSAPVAETLRPPQDVTLTVATWGGAYNIAQQRALFEPFTQATGHKLDNVSHDGVMDRLTREHVATKGWDMLELDARTASRGCADGWLAAIDPAELPASVEGDPATADYLPGALMDCGAGSAAWSAVVVRDTRAEFDEPPQRITDLFALDRFPGKRALPRQAEYVLELALMADGVAPSEVYEVLATQSGQDRAFARLSAVRHAIVWWDNPVKAFDDFTASGPSSISDVVLGVAFNGRVFTSAVRAHQWLSILWDGQIYQFNYWAIPVSAPNADVARELLRDLSLPERQARLTRWFPYGPVRKSALPLVSQHAEIDLDMAGFVPTMARNTARALRFDAGFWDKHGNDLKARFADWLKLPAPQVPADQFVPPTPARALRTTSLTVQ